MHLAPSTLWLHVDLHNKRHFIDQDQHTGFLRQMAISALLPHLCVSLSTKMLQLIWGKNYRFLCNHKWSTGLLADGEATLESI